MKRALYPGSFDPITFGHINLIERALPLFDEVLVAVVDNPKKSAFFTPEERVDMIKQSFENHPLRQKLRLDHFSGLLVDYARTQKASVLLRGLRSAPDFEIEFQMAHANRKIGQGLETFFMMTGEEFFYISSQFVREVASFGGDVSAFVPPHVAKRLIVSQNCQ